MVFKAEAIRTIGAIADLGVESDVGIRVVEPESSSFARYSGVELVDRVLEALLGAAETLLRVTEPQFGARQCEPAMTRR